jgi:4-amino-4-deoxy-L-arabinose transferase-like glycosyltransferase
LRGYFLADDFVLLGWTHSVPATEIGRFFDPGDFWFYRPLVKVYYWLGQTLFGLRPEPFHALSLGLHGTNAYLLYRFVRAQGAGGVVGLAAGLLFLLNPHHAETVSWIAATGDLAGAFCVLTSLSLYQRFAERGRAGYLVTSLVFFAVGLLTRETAVMLPLLALLAVLLLRPAGSSFRRAFAGLMGYVVILTLYLGVQAASDVQGAGALERGGLQFRPLGPESVLLGVMEYVHGLVPGGGLLAQLPLDALRVVAWVELLALAVLAALLWRLGERVGLFGLGWMLATPLLFVFFSPPTDRYYYLPSMGFAMLAAVLLAHLPLRLPSLQTFSIQRVVRGVAGLVLVLLLLWQAQGLAAREFAWKVAGDASRSVFLGTREAVPEPRDYTTFFLVDAPLTYNGVPTFVNTLPQAVQLLYENDTLAASIVSCDWLREQPELPRFNHIFRFTGAGIEKLASERDCQ